MQPTDLLFRAELLFEQWAGESAKVQSTKCSCTMNWVMLRFGRRSLLRGIPVQSIEWNVLDLRACSGATGSRCQWSNFEGAFLLYGGV